MNCLVNILYFNYLKNNYAYNYCVNDHANIWKRNYGGQCINIVCDVTQSKKANEHLYTRMNDGWI